MPVIEAAPLEMELGQLLDAGALGGITAEPPPLNGGIRRSGSPDHEPAWMEPPPGVEPGSRTRLQVSTEGSWGGSRLMAHAEVYELPQGEVLRLTSYTLTLAIGRDGESETLRWWLEPGGDNATLRADALDLLAGLHRGGILTVLQPDDRREVAQLPLVPQPFDEDLEEARVFLSKVAALEEWSGLRIPVPRDVDAASATEVARAVAIVMARQIPLLLGDTLTVTISAVDEPLSIDELRLPWMLTQTILGTTIPMGAAELVVSVVPTQAEEQADGSVRVACRLADDQPRRVHAHLYPPDSRSRVLRRTLVGGAAVPPRGEGLLRQIDVLRLDQLGQLLDEWEAEDGPLPPDLRTEVRREWDG